MQLVKTAGEPQDVDFEIMCGLDVQEGLSLVIIADQDLLILSWFSAPGEVGILNVKVCRKQRQQAVTTVIPHSFSTICHLCFVITYVSRNIYSQGEKTMTGMVVVYMDDTLETCYDHCSPLSYV